MWPRNKALNPTILVDAKELAEATAENESLNKARFDHEVESLMIKNHMYSKLASAINEKAKLGETSISVEVDDFISTAKILKWKRKLNRNIEYKILEHWKEYLKPKGYECIIQYLGPASMHVNWSL